MSLKDVFETVGSPRNIRTCLACKALKSMNAEDADFLNALLDNGEIYATTICKALNAAGHVIGVGSIKRHRAGECAARRNVG